MKNKRDFILNLLCGIVSIGFFLMIWDFGARGDLGRLLPRPLPVIESFFGDLFTGRIGKYPLIIHTLYSLGRVMMGYFLGSFVGVILGLSMGWNKTVEAIFSPIVRIIRPIPPIAWIPISIIWLGLGEDAKVFLIFLAAFSFVTINAWSGVKRVDPELINAAKMLGAKRAQLLFSVALPATIPPIFAGLQVALSSCWATVLAAEMVRSSEGLGWVIIAGMNNNDMLQIMVGIITIALVGLALSIIFRKIEAILCRWNKSGS